MSQNILDALAGIDLRMTDMSDSGEFQSIVMPHLDEAYSLARWLMGNATGAEDVVQDALLRALRYFASFKGRNARAWLLRIVRNVAYAALRKERGAAPSLLLDRDGADGNNYHGSASAALADPGGNPEILVAAAQQHSRLDALLAELPVAVRECVVLRELHECSYQEIAAITGAPIGTVTSRIFRGRRMLVRLAAEDER